MRGRRDVGMTGELLKEGCYRDEGPTSARDVLECFVKGEKASCPYFGSYGIWPIPTYFFERITKLGISTHEDFDHQRRKPNNQLA